MTTTTMRTTKPDPLLTLIKPHLRLLAAAVPACAAALALAACKGGGGGAGGAGGGDGLTVGFAQVGAESAWRVAETESVKSEAAARGVDLKFADAQGKQENQIAAVRSFIAQGVDAIILAPVVETGWDPVLTEAKDAEIPVVLVDRGVAADEGLYATLIASDFVAEGRMAAEWLAEKTGGQAKVIELQGTPGAAPAIDRKRGFEEGIAAHPGIEIIASQSGDFNIEKGKEVTEALLTQHKDTVTAVYAHNDDMALGAIQALKEAGKNPGTDVLVVSIDGVRGAFDAMVAGELNCTVECNPLLGPAAFDAVEAALAGKPLPKKSIVEDRVFPQETAAAELPERKY
jgi:simple sugar transport system substrate-binding protein